MKTKAAVLWGINQKWEIEEIDLDPPKEDEVLVKMTVAGCVTRTITWSPATYRRRCR